MELSGYNSDVLRIELEMSAREFWNRNFWQKLFTWPLYLYVHEIKITREEIRVHVKH